MKGGQELSGLCIRDKIGHAIALLYALSMTPLAVRHCTLIHRLPFHSDCNLMQSASPETSESPL